MRGIYIKRIFSLCLILVSLSTQGCKDNPTENKENLEPIDFLPVNYDIEGWTKSLAENDYIYATSSKQLEQIVGADYDIYVKYKFQKGVKQIYEGKIGGADETLEVRIFDQLSMEYSQDLYHDKKIAPTTTYSILPNTGDEARIQRIIESGTLIDFYYDKFYVWISISGRWGETEARAVARVFAIEISDKIRQLYNP
ncbi:hypothetical protein JXJ21_24825 [candidate division KSB1 bacterium]|nr:hypothetical protein [candidate division KSB1 bacterium]